MEQLSYIQSIFLGVVQGISEFLPISSSAHLIICSWLFSGKPLPLELNVAFHFGTLAAVLLYFQKTWREIIWASWQKLRYKKSSFHADKLLPALIVGNIPAAILGFTAKDWIREHLHTPMALVLPLATVGIALWFVDKFFGSQRSLQHIDLKDAIGIGLAQACALIPGVSRSGATIIGARFLGLDKSSAAEFSFLLGAPVMFGATLLSAKDLLAYIANPNFYLGIFVSFAVGLLAIGMFLKFVKNFGFMAFALYRVFLSLFIYLYLSDSM